MTKSPACKIYTWKTPVMKDAELYRMAFHLSSKVVVLQLVNSTASAYLCDQHGRLSIFLSRLAYHILDLADKHAVTAIQVYIPTHFNRPTLCHGDIGFRMASFSSQSSSSVSASVSAGGGFVGNLTYQSMSSLLNFGNSITSGNLVI